jgi:hypothetical protein
MERWIESEAESATRRPSISCTVNPTRGNPHSGAPQFSQNLPFFEAGKNLED